MTRWLGLAIDPTAGGSTLDSLVAAAGGSAITIPDPTVWIPVTTSQVDQGYTNTERNDEVRGVRGSAQPVPFQAAPGMTFSSRLYPRLAKLLFPGVLGKIGTATGSGQAARVTPITPIASGKLPSFIAWMVREDQLDQLTGVVFESVELTVDDGDPMVQVQARALYHQALATPNTIPTATYADFAGDPYSGVTFKAKLGASGSETAVQCVSSFSQTFNNNLVDDQDVRFCKGENVLTKMVGGKYRRRQYPGRHALGEQTISGNIGFGTRRVDMEDRQLIAKADRLVAEMSGNPLGTTPPVDEVFRNILSQWVITDGSPGELVRTGEIKSSYEWTAHLDATTQNDITVEVVDSTAVVLA